MNEWLKIILPVLLTGLGVLVWDISGKVANIEKDMAERMKYLVVFEHLRKDVDDHEERIRLSEDCTK